MLGQLLKIRYCQHNSYQEMTGYIFAPPTWPAKMSDIKKNTRAAVYIDYSSYINIHIVTYIIIYTHIFHTSKPVRLFKGTLSQQRT